MTKDALLPPATLLPATLLPAPPSPAPAAAPPAPEPRPRHGVTLDGVIHAAEAMMSGGLSLGAQWLAFADWGLHLSNAPFRRYELAQAWARQLHRLYDVAAFGETAIEPAPNDHRFKDADWRTPPFNFYAQGFLLTQEWLEQAAKGPRGVEPANSRIVSFALRQLADMASPSNLPWLNPEVLREAMNTGGANFVVGAVNFLTDLQEAESGRPSGQDQFVIGRDLAATPGEVVYRNELIELIQYAPTTSRARPQPVLIVPAWIMKYYILDLSAHNSVIRLLVAQGFTVFCISWRNPGSDQRDLSLEDYRRLGVMAALDAVSDICGGTKIHACGYCLGGTMLAIAASAMARDGDDRLQSVTLLCAQTDFSEPGELQLFITEDQVAFLEDMMRAQGYLDSRQMSGAFRLLRSNDLVWSRMIKTGMLGQRTHPNDLMAWNADGTRMPARMHAEYLRRLFLEDALAEGRYFVEGRPIVVGDVRVPMFVVGTETDHIAPWRSVYKIHLLNEGEITFALTSGGHNAGVVSEPGHKGRRFSIARRAAGALYVGPDEWLKRAERREGSWQPAWWAWLAERSGEPVAPPPSGSARYPALYPAPGAYVREP